MREGGCSRKKRGGGHRDSDNQRCNGQVPTGFVKQRAGELGVNPVGCVEVA